MKSSPLYFLSSLGSDGKRGIHCLFSFLLRDARLCAYHQIFVFFYVKGYVAIHLFNDAPRFGVHEKWWGAGLRLTSSPFIYIYYFIISFLSYFLLIPFLFSIFYFILDVKNKLSSYQPSSLKPIHREHIKFHLCIKKFNK